MRRTTVRPWPAMLKVAGLCLSFAPFTEAVTIKRGPYLQLQTPNSISVVWLTDTDCTGEVEWGSAANYGKVSPPAAPATRHEIAITGLSPDALYHYRVRCDGVAMTKDATFRTAPPDDAKAVSFTFVGDSCSEPRNSRVTYTAMLPQTANGFCITLGDLAGRGEDNLTDYWQSHFFVPAADFVKHICMYPCLGNHELYDERSFPKYVAPTKYLAAWSLPTDGSGTECYYSFDKGPVHFAALDTFGSSLEEGSDQLKWLARDLAATTKPWKIVFGHNTPYISQLGKSDGSAAMRSGLAPLLKQRKVDLYLHGHYHDYQRNLIDGVCYIDQGTGGQGLTKRADDRQSYVQAYAGGDHCYTRINIQGDRLLGWCYRTSDGACLDGYQIDKKPVARPWQDTFPSTGNQLNWIAPGGFSGQCGPLAREGNLSGDGHVFQVADTSGPQYAYPMLASESMTDTSIEAHVYYDAASTVSNRYGVGLRGRLLFDPTKRSCYLLAFVRNNALGSNGHALLIAQEAGAEVVLADWAYPDTSAWHRVKFSAIGGELSVWIDGVLKTATPIKHDALPKGRPFIYNLRAEGGARTLVDDVVIR